MLRAVLLHTVNGFFESVELHFFQHLLALIATNDGLNVKCNNDYSVQNDELLHRYSTNEIRARKRDKKVRRDLI